MCQKAAVGDVFSSSCVRVYDEPWPHCCAGVRASKPREALRAITKIAREASALPLSLWSEAFAWKGLGRQKA